MCVDENSPSVRLKGEVTLHLQNFHWSRSHMVAKHAGSVHPASRFQAGQWCSVKFSIQTNGAYATYKGGDELDPEGCQLDTMECRLRERDGH
jgi:hypothetical protein